MMGSGLIGRRILESRLHAQPRDRKKITPSREIQGVVCQSGGISAARLSTVSWLDLFCQLRFHVRILEMIYYTIGNFLNILCILFRACVRWLNFPVKFNLAWQIHNKSNIKRDGISEKIKFVSFEIFSVFILDYLMDYKTFLYHTQEIYFFVNIKPTNSYFRRTT